MSSYTSLILCNLLSTIYLHSFDLKILYFNSFLETVLLRRKYLKELYNNNQNVDSQLPLLNKFFVRTDDILSQESVLPHLIINTMININITENISFELPSVHLNIQYLLSFDVCLLKCEYILSPYKYFHLLLFSPSCCCLS